MSRIDAIIRSLRQFTRRAELETSLHTVDLAQMFSAAWELLATASTPLVSYACSAARYTAAVSGDEKNPAGTG